MIKIGEECVTASSIRTMSSFFRDIIDFDKLCKSYSKVPSTVNNNWNLIKELLNKHTPDTIARALGGDESLLHILASMYIDYDDDYDSAVAILDIGATRGYIKCVIKILGYCELDTELYRYYHRLYINLSLLNQ